jgi:hypothetical protein
LLIWDRIYNTQKMAILTTHHSIPIMK